MLPFLRFLASPRALSSLLLPIERGSERCLTFGGEARFRLWATRGFFCLERNALDGNARYPAGMNEFLKPGRTRVGSG